MSAASDNDRPDSRGDEEFTNADSANPLTPSGRWLSRQFIDSQIHPSFQAAIFPAEVSDQRCIELAAKSLYMDDFIELIGIGGGSHGSYFVDEGGVTFRQWDAEYINQAPVDWQVEMRRDNRTAPQLSFPCSSIELLRFVDTAIGIQRFIAPEAFRQATLRSAQQEGFVVPAPSSVTPAMKVSPPRQTVNGGVYHITTHSTKDRRNVLDYVIDKAAREKGSLNTSDVWVCLAEWASSETPPSPLVGFMDEGIQYKGKNFQSDGSLDILTKRVLDSRMRRRREKANPSLSSLSLVKPR